MKKVNLVVAGTMLVLLLGCDDAQTSKSGTGAQSGASAGPQQTGSTATSGADRQADLNNTPGMQTFTGVLLDASCDALLSATGGSTEMSGNAAAVRSDPGGGARTGDTGSGGSAGNPNAVTPETSGEAARRATGGPSQAGSRPGGAGPGDPDRASAAAGTTGAGSGKTESGPTSGTLGAGDRGMGEAHTGAMMPKEYSRCAATQSSSGYAVFANGRVLRLDSGSNAMVREQLRSDLRGGSADRARNPQRGAEGAADAAPLHVQVTGSVSNGQIKASSVRKMAVGGGER